ncbi:MAG: response regulator [ANME-2 cluster archaeon]|nr:response regulator [ANME-2 cluster archaeon]MBC2700533.1 response regulator [ANME-2 cluster archaeon]MBC2706522.1 response regulator [ANME-2 cluster archaeon]MBC2745843.1 response regulator [ANME-2 cluster archaeon]MBC2762525.1 response regulator [ANME-2 cluster archaeon]
MKRVLVVEDNENNMKLLCLVLEKFGYEPIKAYTGEEGVEKAIQERADLILMDIQLPDINGLEAVKRIRMLDDMQEIPIIAITSYAMSGDREMILDMGCNGYFEKPINPLTLMEDIEKIVRSTNL